MVNITHQLIYSLSQFTPNSEKKNLILSVLSYVFCAWYLTSVDKTKNCELAMESSKEYLLLTP
jgi:hypothetical protein